MQLEQQVCSLELAKKLKELGVKQESLFYWIESYDPEDANNGGWSVIRLMKPNKYNYSAFTVAELGEMLPKAIKSKVNQDMEDIFYLEIDWIGGKNRCRYVSDGKYLLIDESEQITSDTEADARAKMRIYLIENKLINP